MKPYYGGVIWTNHAIERLKERRIAQSDAFYTFQHSDGQMSGTTPRSIRYYKDYGDQRIEVVAARNEKKEWIILSCWSKIIGTGRPYFAKNESLWITVIKKLLGIKS
ncbi:MAG: DUF4258 domain-containing protein [bacterium]|nr:DUF4258 domain-containing protein [bacterium]